MAIVILSIIMGAWLLFDGTHVLLKGKYFGPPESGPWSTVIGWIGINPFSLGVPFIILGFLWLVNAGLHLTHHSWTSTFAAVIAVSSLWYLPFGTVISTIVLILLWFA